MAFSKSDRLSPRSSAPTSFVVLGHVFVSLRFTIGIGIGNSFEPISNAASMDSRSQPQELPEQGVIGLNRLREIDGRSGMAVDNKNRPGGSSLAAAKQER
jgi:hypothetical protein